MENQQVTIEQRVLDMYIQENAQLGLQVKRLLAEKAELTESLRGFQQAQDIEEHPLDQGE